MPQNSLILAFSLAKLHYYYAIVSNTNRKGKDKN